MDDVDRAAARLNRAAEWAGFTVAVVVAALIGGVLAVVALAALAWYVLDRIGTPV